MCEIFDEASKYPDLTIQLNTSTLDANARLAIEIPTLTVNTLNQSNSKLIYIILLIDSRPAEPLSEPLILLPNDVSIENRINEQGGTTDS